ncbi:MAG: hypothetical protein RJA70_4687 [Pseudomonadota bacterium]|jgi:C4-dicarboxylate-specific signal transduction histidine kinase
MATAKVFEEITLALEDVAEVLTAVARGDFAVRAPRSFRGDSIDVLAFLVNSTAEEVSDLVEQLENERTELRQARDQLVMAAKLAALGELAAGVAHELNQPLTAIQMLADMLLRRPERKLSECEGDLQMLSEAARRMARIVDGVRTFGRPGQLRRVPTQPAAPLMAAIDLLAGTLSREGVTLEVDIEHDTPGIEADPDQLNQVFVNLLTNARDALRSLSSGSPRRVQVCLWSTPSSVAVSVEDSGLGIDPLDASRIFDPFFTTKGVGEGTGLGLSVSHGIVSNHGGSLSYQPSKDGGARFVVVLPLRPDGVAR